MCSSSVTLFLSASLALISILSFNSALYPANFSMDSSISYWFPPSSFHTFSPTLSNLIPALSFVTFSHTALPAMAGNLFFGIFLVLECHYCCSRIFVLSGYIPSSALTSVLPVVLEHPNTFVAAVICIVSSCFSNFAFPSHTYAYSSFGTFTFIRIRILLLVSWCESVRIGSILPT